MAGKPGATTTPATADEDKAGNEAGQLGMDDRGNVTWEWSDKAKLQADDEVGAAERVRALVDPSLDVVDHDGESDDPMAANPRRLKTGYNPYNSGTLGKQTWKKKKDLRELSSWIELRRKMAEKKQDE